MITQIETLKSRYHDLEEREQLLLIGTMIVVIITVFYLAIWEPVFNALAQQQAQYQSQRETLAWMQNASTEISQLKQSGKRAVTSTNKPISLVIDQSASSSGLKSSIGKLESSGKDDVRVKLDSASFDQMLVWLNILEKSHGINVTSATIERTEKQGFINARLSFKRS